MVSHSLRYAALLSRLFRLLNYSLPVDEMVLVCLYMDIRCVLVT